MSRFIAKISIQSCNEKHILLNSIRSTFLRNSSNISKRGYTTLFYLKIKNNSNINKYGINNICVNRSNNNNNISNYKNSCRCYSCLFNIDKKYITRYWAEYNKPKIDESKINELREQFEILKDYNDKDLMIWLESFNKMDKDHDNFISHADLQKSDWSLEKYTLFQGYDMDKNNLIDFGEYIQAVIAIDTQYFKNFFQDFSKIDIDLEFQKYAITEKENDKKVIPLTKLMQMLKDKEFTCVTETDSIKLFNAMDINKDGSIDFEDFVQWLGKE
ncbi:EF-hand calcium-binding domain-containing protein, putative [Hepatocystis sp. ex Piliocolobus tephrosceles]|nr:EF-hand calcium-binding domain-containing protein, putative [Hepatocystis sp. ex Piliocolobus tephrosceles]